MGPIKTLARPIFAIAACGIGLLCLAHLPVDVLARDRVTADLATTDLATTDLATTDLATTLPARTDAKAPPMTQAPKDGQQFAAAMPAASGRGGAKLVPFEASAFPYDGQIPDQNKPFLDVVAGDRRGHTSPRGGILWADQAYSDRRTLLYVPSRFDIRKPATIIVYFHGNSATLERDVEMRQHVPQQVLLSGLNAVLVAPQLAVDALDSSAGHFWEPGFFARFLDEAAVHLSQMSGIAPDAFRRMPVVIVAYSGGYLPAIFSAESGGVSDRLRGMVLLDALFGETDRYARWIASYAPYTFFFSAYSKSASEGNSSLRSALDASGVKYHDGLPATLGAGTIVFLSAGDRINHNDFVTQAWTDNPLRDVLAHISEFRR